MSTTLLQLQTAVNDRLRNYHEWDNATATGDNATTKFKLPCAPDETIVSGTLTCQVDGITKVETTHWTADYDTAWFTFLSAPATDAVITWQYEFIHWSDEYLTELINDALDYLYGEFYVPWRDTHYSGDGSTTAFTLPPDTGVVSRIEDASSGTAAEITDYRLEFRDPYKVLQGLASISTSQTTLPLASGNGFYVQVGDALIDAAKSEVVAVTAVSTDNLTITRGYHGTTAQTHAASAVWTLWNTERVIFGTAPNGALVFNGTKHANYLSSATDTLEYTAGFPTRAKNPVVQYVIWQLLDKAIARRARDDRALYTQNEDAVAMRDLSTAMQFARMDFELHAKKLRMNPPKKKVRYEL